MTNLDTAKVLEDAADLLLIKGRCTVEGRNKYEQYCVLGAIAEVQGKYLPGKLGEERIYNDDDPAVVALANHVAPQLDGRRCNPDGCTSADRSPSTNVYGWNDWMEHDDFEVIDTLRIVAKDLRNGA